MSGLQIIDVTLPALVRGRDLPDEILGTVAGWLDTAGFQMIEVADGCSFLSSFDMYGKDPWERIRIMTDQLKRTPPSMLVRGRFLLGESPQPDRVIAAFVDHCASCGVKIVRVYDPLGDMAGLQTVFKEIRTSKRLAVQGCLPVTGDNLKQAETIAGTLVDMGAGSLCLWISPEGIPVDRLSAAVIRIKKAASVPVYVQFGGPEMLWHHKGLFGSDPAPDGLVTGLGASARHLEVPRVETAWHVLNGFSASVAPEALVRLNEDTESLIRDIPESAAGYGPGLRLRAAIHRVPPGLAAQASLLLEEADARGIGDQVMEEAVRIRQDLGNFPLVPPISRLVAIQAVNNLLFDTSGKRYTVVSDGFREICSGSFGRLPETADPAVCRQVCQSGSAAARDDKDAKTIQIDAEAGRGDSLIRCMFPEAGSCFLFSQDFGWDPMETGQAETAVSSSDPETAGTSVNSGPVRRFRVEVEGTLFDVGVSETNGNPEILGVSQLASAGTAVPDAARVPAPEAPVVSKPKPRPVKVPEENVSPKEPAPSGDILQMKAPMPGTVIRVAVSPGQRVTKGDPVIVLEAMKMENTLPAPESGEIQRIPVVEGGSVAKGELLCEFRRTA